MPPKTVAAPTANDPTRETGFTKTIRKYITAVSLAVFFGSALLLFLVLYFGATGPRPTIPQAFLKLAEEVLKGLLTASAVAVLYDWVMKAETKQEMLNIIGDKVAFLVPLAEQLRQSQITLEAKFQGVQAAVNTDLTSARESLNKLCNDLRVIKFKSEGDEPEAQTAYLKEFVLAPLSTTFPEEIRKKFYQIFVHSRFRAYYFGETVKFVLGKTGKFRKDPDDDLIFYWQIDLWPAATLDVNWLEVVRLRVNGEPWELVAPKKAEADVIIAEFKKPASSKLPFACMVTYEYDVRVLDNYVSPGKITFNIEYMLVRPTIRVDARRIGSNDVVPTIISSDVRALTGKFLDTPEGEGTCEVFFEGSVRPGAAVMFTMTGHN